MNSEKKIKKNTPQIKKNEVVFSNNVMKPSPNINNIVLKSSLATKNEEININNSNFEESKKKSNFKRDISQSNSSNRRVRLHVKYIFTYLFSNEKISLRVDNSLKRHPNLILEAPSAVLNNSSNFTIFL